jgi:predicted  nucleic acid-binding Zn-ribbon protein
MGTQVAVKLTDTEWRLKCEELAKLELRRKAKRGQLAEEEDEWKERKKDLNGQIDMMTEQIEKLATEVDTKEALVEAQTELPLQSDAPAGPISSEEPQVAREPGAEG